MMAMFEGRDAVVSARARFAVTISTQITLPAFAKIADISVTYSIHSG
jgi:hypothetical protein